MKNQFLGRYIIFGIITSFLNYALFFLLCFLGLFYKLANIITLIIVKIVAFFLNKKYVFQSKSTDMKELWKEIFKYFLSRSGTLLIDYFLLIFLVDIIHLSEFIGKGITIVVVVVINYLLCKNYVFINKEH